MDDMIDDAPADRGLAEPWLDKIAKAEAALKDWQDAADNIDKQYGELSRLRSVARDREFALFWSNIQVMGPSVYARPPVPVVTPKFKDRRPLYRAASEFLERACVVAFDLADIDETMISLRDDLTIVGRGAGWLRFESDDETDKVCIEHLDRKDFLHDPARKWVDVDWVARRAWLTKDEMRKRFGEAADEVDYTGPLRDDRGRYAKRDTVDRCGVWEIWCKSADKVVWVTEGSEKVLDEEPPHLKLNGFWPCPKPVYATIQRRTLVPIPDMLQYKDQLEEVNSLTRRIHTLAEAIKMRGFYSGGGDIGDAIARAMKMADDEQVLIPVPNLASLSANGGDPIIWMPLDMLANTITGLIELRRQVIDDVYQIIGLSDIMRGATEAGETLGAQQLKQQNGSYRVRDKQNELIRWARDAVRIAAEIMAEEFDKDTLVDMAQIDLPTDADVKKQIKQIEDQAKAVVEQAKQAAQTGQADPQQIQQQAQQQLQSFEAELSKAQEQVTIDQVTAFLKDEKLRPFVLDIETDSTVYPDEQSEKASRKELLDAFFGAMAGLVPLFQMGPEAVKVACEMLKFALAPYRVGRALDAVIDDLVDRAPEIAERMAAQQGEGEDEGLAAAQMKLAEAEMAKVQSQTEANQANAALKMQELQLKAAEAQSKAEQDRQKFALEIEKTRGTIEETGARVEKIFAEIQKLGVDAENQTRQQDREDVKAVSDITARQTDQAMAAEDRQTDAAFRARGEERADRQQEFQERQPPKPPTTGGRNG